MFLSTFEKQLDAKRRIVVPQEFRAAAAGPFDGVFCFPSIEADCIEGGGQALFDRYLGADRRASPSAIRCARPWRPASLAAWRRLSYDTAGRITLPETLCEAFQLTDWVAVVGLGERFQIWSRDVFQRHRRDQREAARAGLAALRPNSGWPEPVGPP